MTDEDEFEDVTVSLCATSKRYTYVLHQDYIPTELSSFEYCVLLSSLFLKQVLSRIAYCSVTTVPTRAHAAVLEPNAPPSFLGHAMPCMSQHSSPQHRATRCSTFVATFVERDAWSRSWEY